MKWEMVFLVRLERIKWRAEIESFLKWPREPISIMYIKPRSQGRLYNISLIWQLLDPLRHRVARCIYPAIRLLSSNLNMWFVVHGLEQHRLQNLQKGSTCIFHLDRLIWVGRQSIPALIINDRADQLYWEHYLKYRNPSQGLSNPGVSIVQSEICVCWSDRVLFNTLTVDDLNDFASRGYHI